MSVDGDSKLVLRAETVLANAELREPDWDALSARVESMLATASVTDDSLLLPPLPESSEDGREELAVRANDEPESETGPTSQRGSASLAELARAAVARRSSKDAVDLAKASLAIASQGRALAETPRRPVTEAATPVAAVSTGERERNTVPPARRERAALDTRGPWIGVAIAAVGLAAGFGLYVASRTTASRVSALPSAEAPVAATTTAASPRAAANTAAAKTDPPSEPRSEPAELLPVEKQAAAASLPSPVPAPERSVAAVKSVAPAAEPRSTGAAAVARTRPEKVVLDEEPKAAANRPPKPGSSAMRPAELNATSGGMSDRPSTGAAQAAVGAVLGAARSCIAGQPQASSATIVFGSSGEVTSVNVSGPAEGTPAAACIKAALGKARVQPFAASNFSLGVTVRPL
jgi:hypothetical protein